MTDTIHTLEAQWERLSDIFMKLDREAAKGPDYDCHYAKMNELLAKMGSIGRRLIQLYAIARCID